MRLSFTFGVRGGHRSGHDYFVLFVGVSTLIYKDYSQEGANEKPYSINRLAGQRSYMSGPCPDAKWLLTP
jgi:hypothetical protein